MKRPEKEKKLMIIYANFQDKDLYGYADPEYCFEGETPEDMVDGWLKLHKEFFTEEEFNRLHIIQIARNSKEGRRFLDRTLDVFNIYHYLDRCPFLVTGYEAYLYKQTIQEYYSMYQNVVIAGKLLPPVLNQEIIHDKMPLNEIKRKQNMSITMDNLRTLSEIMYESVQSKESFVSFLSTTFIKDNLLMHPLCAMGLYAEEMRLNKSFRYHMNVDK